ncbi:hypothetical protein SeMB42_g07422 [Synchytrium endobioticum]|uniref:Uncharacterized protein n=1 Tax=Synchytrium endobioticum TaxID=286115 RepID=A0A507BWT9_9FUNG|nr:hypothetical protein SeMB42_g07422 [Synchytrium endobioticum]
MAKFTTISLLAYVAALLFFTPVNAPHPEDEPYIQGIISAVTNPTTQIDLIGYIQSRIKDIESFGLAETTCTKEDVFKVTKNIPKECIPLVRSYHHTAFDSFNQLFKILTVCINDYRCHDAIQVLYEARALVCFHINRHYRLERAYRKRTPKQLCDHIARLTRPTYDWKSLKGYKTDIDYLDGTLHDGPDSGYGVIDAPTYVSEPQGALPAPSSSLPAWPFYSGTRHDGPDSGYALLYDSAQLSGSTSREIQLSDIYMDPPHRHHGPEFERAAHDHVGSSGGLTLPHRTIF